jgi:hypothetical protein
MHFIVLGLKTHGISHVGHLGTTGPPGYDGATWGKIWATWGKIGPPGVVSGLEYRAEQKILS